MLESEDFSQATYCMSGYRNLHRDENAMPVTQVCSMTGKRQAAMNGEDAATARLGKGRAAKNIS